MGIEYTDKEKTALEQFRKRIDNLLCEMTEEQQKDYNLMRWIRAREFNLEKAEEMLRQSLKWRKEHDAEHIMEWRPPEIFKEYFPFYVTGKDKDGCYVNVSPIGSWDIRKILDAGYGEELKKGTVQYLELASLFARHATAETGTPITQFVHVSDMEGYSMVQLLSSKVRESNIDSMKVMEANYPELLKRAIVINAPKVFAMLFGLVKPFLSDHTKSKIQIFDSNRDNWSKVLLEHIDPDELPSKYGGTNTTCTQFLLDNGIKIGPRAPNFPADQFLSTTVPAAREHTVEVKVDTVGTILSWNFRTDDYDIGFKFLHEEEELYNVRRCDSHLYTQKGVHVCEETGTYTLVFDNTYSKMRSKTLYYYVDSKIPAQESTL